MDKRVNVQLNANRRISGIVRGFDAFMNVVLDETVEHRQQQPSTNDASKHPNAVEKSIGMVVCIRHGFCHLFS